VHSTPKFSEVVARLRDGLGAPAQPEITSPFEMALLENCAYLVDDERRFRVFGRLRDEVGLEPEAILATSPERLEEVIADGGMRPPMRAEKLYRCAAVARSIGLENLTSEVRAGTSKAKRWLRRFPGFGEPAADRVLLFNGAARTLAPDSNVLRVLIRLGFGREHKDYATTYRDAEATVGPSLPHGQAELVEAHLLLRELGKETCRRASPRCPACPLSRLCPSSSLGA
jgi:endonuclease III